jgi:MFS transporter, DHA2 family, glioxin efflux transporter
MGGAGIASGAYTIIAFSVTPQRQPAFTGILGAVFSVASVVGPLLGGVFTTDVSWRWCFYINLPIGGLSAALIVFFFTTPKQAKPVEAELKEKFLQLDLPGSFLFMAACVCFLLALQWGGATKTWGNSSVVGTLVGAALIFVVFLGNEWFMNERALLVRRILTNKTIAFACAFQFFNSAAFMVDLYFLPEYFQTVSGVSAAQSGVRNIPFIVGISLLTIVSGGAITVTGHYIPAMVIGSIISSIGTGLIYTFDVGTPSSQWIGYQALAGIGIGIGIQVPIIIAQSTVGPTDLSSATAMLLFFQTLAGAIFISVAQSIFSNELVHSVAKNIPGVNPGQVVATGATDIRRVFGPEMAPQIIASFMSALKNTYILAIAMAGMSALVAIAIVIFDWRTLKGAKVAAAA